MLTKTLREVILNLSQDMDVVAFPFEDKDSFVEYKDSGRVVYSHGTHFRHNRHVQHHSLSTIAYYSVSRFFVTDSYEESSLYFISNYQSESKGSTSGWLTVKKKYFAAASADFSALYRDSRLDTTLRAAALDLTVYGTPSQPRRESLNYINGLVSTYQDKNNA